MGKLPKVFLHMMKIYALLGALKSVGDKVPDPDGSIGDNQYEFRL